MYAAVLAGGSGLRMGGETPKQFVCLEGVPVIVRSLRAFVKNGRADRLYAAVPESYAEHTRGLLREYLPESHVTVVCGGKNRNETLFNVLKEIYSENQPSDEDVILTHDAVRPFIDDRIIDENIRFAREYGACNTVIPAVDTILIKNDKGFISEIPKRSNVFHGQTPQSFAVKKLYELYKTMSSLEMETYTDACSVFVNRGERVFLVPGSRDNIKLTYPEDMEKAKIIIRNTEATE